MPQGSMGDSRMLLIKDASRLHQGGFKEASRMLKGNVLMILFRSILDTWYMN
jgi:hypothetical protein